MRSLLTWAGVNRITSCEKSVNKSVIMLQTCSIWKFRWREKIKHLPKYCGSSTQDDPCRSNIGGWRPLQPLRRWRLCRYGRLTYQTVVCVQCLQPGVSTLAADLNSDSRRRVPEPSTAHRSTFYTHHKHQLLATNNRLISQWIIYNNNNNNDRLTAFDPGQPG